MQDPNFRVLLTYQAFQHIAPNTRLALPNSAQSFTRNARKSFSCFSLLIRLYFRQRSAMALTKRQKEVLDYLVGFLNKHGYSPSFEEIARALKLTSLATVHKHLSTLERKGYLRRGYNQSRSLEITQL